MKVQTLLKIIIITIMVVGCKEKPLAPNTYRINGTVSGLDNGEIYLMAYPKFDTIPVVDGKFQIEKELKNKVGQINIKKDPSERGTKSNTNLQLFVEPTIMSLDMDYENFSNSRLVGSNSQDIQYRLDAIEAAIAKNYQKEQAEFNQIRKKYREAVAAKASEDILKKIKYEDNEAREKLAPMWDKQNKATIEFLKENPKSYTSVVYLSYQLRNMKYDEAKLLYNQLDTSLISTEFKQNLLKKIEDMKKGVPGVLAGNFDTTDINGKPLKLSDFKGKYLLIDFWASWCVPCRKGNPHLISLYKEYHSKGLEILGVSDDDRNPKAWRKAVEKDQIGIWHHVLRGATFDRKTMKNKYPEKDINEGYNISALPTKILVDPEGIIVGRYGDGIDAEMDEDLANIFGK